MSAIAVALAALLATSAAGAAETRFDGVTEQEVAVFLATLQVALRADKPAAVADLVVFPLRVNAPTSKAFVKTRGEFVRGYARIFTPPVRSAILAQSAADLFRNWQGFMIGNGEIWFRGVCPDPSCSTHRIGVVTVNVPGDRQ